MQPKKLRVRKAMKADQPRIKALVFGVLDEFSIGRCGADQQDEDLNDLASWYSAPDGVFEVIEDENGTLLGCGGVHPISKQHCELRKMYFAPALRGHGIGSALLHRLVNFAKRTGYSSMELETASVLQSAIGLYQKRGFTEIEKKHDLERCDRAFELKLINYRPPETLAELAA